MPAAGQELINLLEPEVAQARELTGAEKHVADFHGFSRINFQGLAPCRSAQIRG